MPSRPPLPGTPGFLDFGLRGGCASSQLDHGLETLSGEAALAVHLITARQTDGGVFLYSLCYEFASACSFIIGLPVEKNQVGAALVGY